MPYILKEKIKIGVSACNFGAKVRYNRKGADRIAGLGREKDAFIWTPVCPEAVSGLGVPRPPMKLVGGSGDDFWQGKARMKNRQGQIVTQQVKAGALAALENLKRAEVEACVFMDGSPSCGVYRTTLKNRRLGKPPGVFGSLLLAEDLFLIPALDLESPLKWWDWRRRLHAFVWLKRFVIKNKTEFQNIWHNYKFLVREIDRPEADRLGKKLAGFPKKLTARRVGRLKREILLVLRKPTTVKRIQNSAERQMSYYCKRFNVCYTEKLPPAEKNKQKFVDKLIEMEKRAATEGIDYGFVPVLYRNN